MNEQQLGMWDEANVTASDISLADMDNFVKDFRDKEADYDTKKKVSNAAKVERDAAKAKVLSMLTATGRKSYKVEGLGTVTQVNLLKYRTPQTIEDKRAMLNYLATNYTPDVVTGLTTVQYQTLNSFINAEMESNPEFRLPGVEEPTAEQHLRFKKG